MTNEKIIQGMQSIADNICKINEEYNKSKRWRRVFAIQEEITSFKMQKTEEDLYIYYNSACIGVYNLNKQEIVYPFMMLYTNVLYKMNKAKVCCEISDIEELQKQIDSLGAIIHEVCNAEFEDFIISSQNVKQIKVFIKEAVAQLYHCAGPIGEFSTKVVPEDAEKLKNIREIYESLKVGRKYVYFYDEILKKVVKINIDSKEIAYAIMMLYARAYSETIIWLKEYDPSEQWCPLVAWKVIKDFEMLLRTIFKM